MNKPVIIVIDDVEFYLQLIKEYCSDIEANIVTFISPIEAVNYAKKNICDIAIIDYLMPDMNGIELSKKLKAISPDIFIIMITSAVIDPLLKLEALESGASEFLNKPVYMAEFIARIKNALEIVNSRNLLKEQTEKEIIKNEKKLKMLFDILPIGIALTDDNRNLLEVNPELEKILFSTKNDLLDKKCDQFTYFDVNDNKLSIDQLFDIIIQDKSRIIKDFEIKIRIKIKKENKDIWVNISAAPLPIEGYGKVVTVNDITTQKNLKIQLFHAKEAAEAANKAKSSFIKNTSYKMITPLFHICGYSDYLYEELSAHEILEVVKKIKTESMNLIEMINNILDYSKLEADLEEENKSNINLFNLIDEIDKLYKKFAEEKGVDFSLTMDNNLQKNIKVDGVKLKRILKILVSNAIKFTPKGCITIHIMEQSIDKITHLVFIIKDTGIGISKNKMQNLYGVFEHSHNLSENNHDGIGLGLAVAKRLVDLLHGSIDITSDNQVDLLDNIQKNLTSQGTVITLKIPFKKDSVPVELFNNNENALISKNINILVVENNETNIYLLKNFLSKITKQVSIAVTKADVIKKLENNRYDLIFMNISVPEIDGLEITKTFRKDGNDIPIIAIMQYNSIEKMKKGLEAGMNDYISTPFELETLISTIQRVIK